MKKINISTKYGEFKKGWHALVVHGDDGKWDITCTNCDDPTMNLDPDFYSIYYFSDEVYDTKEAAIEVASRMFDMRWNPALYGYSEEEYEEDIKAEIEYGDDFDDHGEVYF